MMSSICSESVLSLMREYLRKGPTKSMGRVGRTGEGSFSVRRRKSRWDSVRMNEIQVGYARVSTADQDLTVQREALLRLGVEDAHIYVDHGMTGTNRARHGLREALAAVRSGDTLVVTKLDRLARSLRDARDIADELTAKGRRAQSRRKPLRPDRSDRAAAVQRSGHGG